MIGQPVLDDAQSPLMPSPASPPLAPAKPVAPAVSPSVAPVVPPKTPVAALPPQPKTQTPVQHPVVPSTQSPQIPASASPAAVKPQANTPIPIVHGKVFATGYSPQKKGDRIEGGYETSVPGPDGVAMVRTLDDVRTGASKYVTLAGDPSMYGRSYIIPSVTFVKDGQPYTLNNVIGVVHDTGSAFHGTPEGRFDVAVAKDLNMAERNQDMSHVQFIPNQAPLPQNIGQTNGTPDPVAGQQTAMDDSVQSDAPLTSTAKAEPTSSPSSGIPEAALKALGLPPISSAAAQPPTSQLPDTVRKALGMPESSAPRPGHLIEELRRSQGEDVPDYQDTPETKAPLRNVATLGGELSEDLDRLKSGFSNPFTETGKAYNESASLAGQGAQDIAKAGSEYWPGILTGQGLVGAGKVLAGTVGSALSPITGTTEALVNKPIEKLDPTLAEGMRRTEDFAPLKYGSPLAKEVASAAETVGKETQFLPQLVSKARGKGTEAAAKDLSSELNTGAEGILSTQRDASKAASATGRLEKAKLDEMETAAKEAGLTAEEAKDYVKIQEDTTKAAESRAKELIEKYQTRPTMSSAELGSQIQKVAVEDMKALKAERAEKSGFEAAMNADHGLPSIPTDRFLSQIKTMEKEAVDPAMRDSLGMLKNSLKTPPSVKNGKPVDAVSIRRMRDTLEVLNDRIDNALPGTAKKLETLRDDLTKHLETTHDAVKVAREKYAKLSEPLDVYRDKGALAKSTKMDPYRNEPIADSSKVVGALLTSGENGSEALARLIAKDPSLRDSARKYFNEQAFGPESAPKGNMSLTQFDNFIKKYESPLKKSGLFDEYTALRDEYKANFATAKTAKSAAEEATGRLTAATDTLKTIEGAKKQTEGNIANMGKLKTQADDMVRDMEKFQTDLNLARTPKDVATQAKSMLKQFYDGHGMSKQDYERFSNQIKDLEEKVKDTEEARKRIWTLAKIIAVTTVPGLGLYLSHRFQ